MLFDYFSVYFSILKRHSKCILGLIFYHKSNILLNFNVYFDGVFFIIFRADCTQTFRLQVSDKAACFFTQQFYMSLFEHFSIQDAYDISMTSLQSSPDYIAESGLFVLLPETSSHDIVLF